MKKRLALVVCIFAGMSAANFAGIAGCGVEYVPWFYLVVDNTYPQDSTNNVRRDTVIAAEFSDELNPSSVTIDSFYLTAGGKPVTATITVDGDTATLKPDESLMPMTLYTAYLTNDIESIEGDELWGGYWWRFSTGNE